MTHDPVTGLLSAGQFEIMLRAAIARAARRGTGVAVLLVDIDGDDEDAPVALARRLAGIVRPGDAVAALGARRLSALCEDLNGRAAAAAVVSRIMTGLQPTAGGAGAVCFAGGAALCFDGTPGDVVLDVARGALDAARVQGPGAYELADATADDDVCTALAVAARALDELQGDVRALDAALAERLAATSTRIRRVAGRMR